MPRVNGTKWSSPKIRCMECRQQFDYHNSYNDSLTICLKCREKKLRAITVFDAGKRGAKLPPNLVKVLADIEKGVRS